MPRVTKWRPPSRFLDFNEVNPQQQLERKTCIVVLGMHRSGTSALTGCLGLLGAELGDNLSPAHPEFNAKGHWENQAAVAVNERILSALGRTWQDERPLPQGWQHSNLVQQFAPEIKAVLARDLASSKLWGLKDPRLCCLLPAWMDAISEAGSAPVFVFCLRHPVEVAHSLARRDGIPDARSCLIWLRYLLDAERASRGCPRVVVSYNELLADWRTALAPLAHRLDLSTKGEAAERIDDFLTSSLRHHEHNEPYLAPSPSFNLADQVYHAFLAHRDDLPARMFDGFRRQADEVALAVAPWSSQIQALLLGTERLETELDRVADRDVLAAEVARIKSTLSWRVTKPFRAFWNAWLNR